MMGLMSTFRSFNWRKDRFFHRVVLRGIRSGGEPLEGAKPAYGRRRWCEYGAVQCPQNTGTPTAWLGVQWVSGLDQEWFVPFRLSAPGGEIRPGDRSASTTP